METKADLISGIRSEIRTVYNNAIGFFVGLRRCRGLGGAGRRGEGTLGQGSPCVIGAVSGPR